MQTPSDQTGSANSYVLDAESGAEMARLTYQHQIVTKFMGGLLPESICLPAQSALLDIACGPGGWVLDVAFDRPKSRVVGIDISQIAIQYAKARAESQGLENNTSFQVMNATKRLDFPDASFDLVNGRFMIGFMAPAAWPNLVRECVRITRPGGYIRLTECDDMGTTTSPAFEKLWGMCARAFQKAGRSFAPAGRNFNITPMLGQFLQQAGYTHVQTIPHIIDFSAGAEAHFGMYQDWMIGLQLLQPFLAKMEAATQQQLEELHQQAMAEMMLNDFRALWYFASAIGQLPS